MQFFAGVERRAFFADLEKVTPAPAAESVQKFLLRKSAKQHEPTENRRSAAQQVGSRVVNTTHTAVVSEPVPPVQRTTADSIEQLEANVCVPDDRMELWC